MKKTSLRIKDVFGYIISKDSISPKQITKLKKIFSENNENNNFSIKLKFFKPRMKKNDIQPSAPPEHSTF